MNKTNKILIIVGSILAVILFIKWLDGPTEFSHLDWGLSKKAVKYELNNNERVVLESDEFILSEIKFGMENEKRLYELYVFSGEKNKFYRGIYFTIPEEGMLKFKPFIEAMNNGYGNPIYVRSDSAEWENETTVVKLKRGKRMHFADVKSKQNASNEKAAYLISRALNAINLSIE